MNEKLIDAARKIREKAYAPYSQFKVGASVLGTSGSIYQGCNIENNSYSLTCCAERVAIFQGITDGETKFQELAVIGDTDEPIIPCGACLQVMAEFFIPEAKIYLCNLKNQVNTVSFAALLPISFKF